MARRYQLRLANSDPDVGVVVALPNALALDDDGWAMLAPYGDTRMQGTPENPDAFRTRFPGVPVDAQGRVTVVQRVDRDAATRLANAFNSVGSRVLRFFRGAPIYIGHPDVPGMQSRYANAEEQGRIAKLDAREGGLYCLPVFNDLGARLLESSGKLGFSAYWKGDPDSEEGGSLIYKPARFVSAGLTPTPNLPVEFLNTAPQMDLKKLIALLAALNVPSVTLANDATEAQVAAAITAIGAHLAGTASLANERTSIASERDQLRTDLAAERKAHRVALLNAAVAEGRIPEADRQLWDGRLTTAFANESAALAALAPRYKTKAVADGARKPTGAAPDAHQELIDLANSKIAANPELTWDSAWRQACREKPALLESLEKASPPPTP